MNIEKLVRHLKEFTLDEIEMIAECDCKTELELLLNENKLVFEHGMYKYKDAEQLKTFDIFEKPIFKSGERILFKNMAIMYLNNRRLTKDTLKGYRSQLKYNIIPFFEGLYADEITYEKILEFVEFMKKKFKPKTASNGVTLLGSILKYAFIEGYIKNNPYFGVRNSMCK